MTISAAVTDKIKTLSDLQTRCNLYKSENDSFFTEWIESLPHKDFDNKKSILKLEK